MVVQVKARAPQEADSESEESSDSQESEENEEINAQTEITNPMLLKPVFVNKNDRAILEPSIQQQEQAQKDEETRQMEAKLKEQKKLYTKAMVDDVIQKEKEDKEKQAVDQMDSDANLPISDSDEEEEEEPMQGDDLEGLSGQRKRGVKAQANFEAWKVRELKRILRDREEVKAYEDEQAEIERRRNLTEAEREEENARLGTDHNQKKQKVAYNFMQKYYHKGAFF